MSDANPPEHPLLNNSTETETSNPSVYPKRQFHLMPNHPALMSVDELPTLILPALRVSDELPTQTLPPYQVPDQQPIDSDMTKRRYQFKDVKHLLEDSEDTYEQFEDFASLPTLVLQAIDLRKDTPPSTMQSEISGAAKGATILGIGNIAGTFLKYGSNFLMQRSFGASLYGLYSVSLSLVTLLASILDLGLDNAMIRHLPVYRAKEQTGLVRGLTIFCTLFVAGISMLGIAALFLCAPWLAPLREELPLLQMMAPMILLSSMQAVWLGGLQGFKAFKWRVLAERICPALVLLALLGATLLFSRDIMQAAFATVISTLVGTVLSLYFLLRLISKTSTKEPTKYEVSTWLGFAVPTFLATITEVVIEALDVLLLAFFAVPTVQIGQYTASSKISDVILMPLTSLNAMFAPTIAELYHTKQHDRLKIMFQIVTKWTITFSFPIFLLAILFSQPLLALSGPHFVAAWPLLVILSLGIMINTGTGCVGYMLAMTGRQKLSLLDSLLAVTINVLLGAYLTTHYGALGVAIATTVTVSLVNMLKLLQVRLLLKMYPYRWDTLKPIGAGLLSGLLTGVLLFLLRNTHIAIQLSLIIVFLALYGGFVALFKISPEDSIVVDTLRRKLMRGKK